MAAADGGVFSFGAPFEGSAGGDHLGGPIASIVSTADGRGYWLLGADGGVLTYGDAPYDGNFH